MEIYIVLHILNISYYYGEEIAIRLKYKKNLNKHSVKRLQFPIPGTVYQNVVTVPDVITVHLGAPDEEANNITIPFIDYIKNVASSELYPTWPENAIRANVYAIVSVALNRIFTDWYRSRGYQFDITSNTGFDQAYVHDRGIYENIDRIVDEIFNVYISREGRFEPLYSLFCDGRKSQCDGLYQWGTIDLSNLGYTPIDILKYYYGEDITLNTAPVGDITYRYTGNDLKLGDSSLDVFRKQMQLNRISNNFPAIPKIPLDGYFDEDTEEAVKVFQRVFNLPVTGIIDKGTWYKIFNLYVAVTKLAELTSEGILIKEIEDELSETLLLGDIRRRVSILQYFLTLLSSYNKSIPPVPITRVFDEATRLAVIEYQKIRNLSPTGAVDRVTWDLLYNEALGIIKSLPPESTILPRLAYPGRNFSLGDEGLVPFVLQQAIQYISTTIKTVPFIEITGVYDKKTKEAVEAFQSAMALNVTGVLDVETWNALSEVYYTQRENQN
ncbi:MAG: putative peptidoglycan-binding protein [Sedimentibacter sp.]|jgi:peptidoglycan hydrolase-like protein with peptidoglycan-binding domain|nr:putative peptidoglycan-binding protein [Sedimentibacter sp.]